MYADKDTGEIKIPATWFDSWFKHHSDKLMKAIPDAKSSSRVEWETVENMLPHYERFEHHVLKEGIGIKNPHYNPDSTDEDPFSVDHQKILIKADQAHRLHSLDEVGLSLDMVTSPSKELEIVTSWNDSDPKVYSTKSSKRVSFVGGSNAAGFDLPMFGIFPSGIEPEWVADAPLCRMGPDDKKLEARFSFNPSGGMTNDMIMTYFESVIVPATQGCEDVDGKRHIQLCDSVGPHVSKSYLDALAKRGIILVPRTPNLSHLQQGEDLVNFGVFKKGVRAKAKDVQNALLVNTGRTSHRDKTLQWNDLMALVKEPWERAFSANNCVSSWKRGGYNPYTRAPLMLVAAKKIEQKKHDESRVEAKRIQKRKNARAEQVFGSGKDKIPPADALAIIAKSNAAYSTVPSLDDDGRPRVKLTPALMAQMPPHMAPTSTEIRLMAENEEAARKAEEERKQAAREIRAEKQSDRANEGAVIFTRVTARRNRQGLNSLKVTELDNLAVYKKHKWEKDTKKKDAKVAELIRAFPADKFVA